MIKTHNEDDTGLIITASVSTFIGLSILIGLLLNDLQFDISRKTTVTREYYCELTDAFGTVFGKARILIPGLMTGLSQIVLWCVLPTQSIRLRQYRLCSTFVIIGIPLVFVSINLCLSACTSVTRDWGVGPELTMIHVVMFFLFLYGLEEQVRILLGALDNY